MPIVYGLAVFIGSYALGGIFCGYLLTGIFHRKNIFKLGDKRPGAANVFREIGPAWGIAAGLLDACKGTVTVLIVMQLFPEPHWYLLIGAAGTVCGHNWPILSRFNGGDGAGITMGTLSAIMPAMLGIITLVYLFFFLLWYLKIKPFYLYHMYNWQSSFCIGVIITWFWEDIFILDYWQLPARTGFWVILLLTIAGLLKQVERFGLIYLLKPSEFRNKYADRLRKKT